ncbi:MAG: GNAT family N-acetyltransferase [Acidovorax sp.]|nr:GNAT family N-acetyltransferase [Acidovorax sp.]
MQKSSINSDKIYLSQLNLATQHLYTNALLNKLSNQRYDYTATHKINRTSSEQTIQAITDQKFNDTKIFEIILKSNTNQSIGLIAVSQNFPQPNWANIQLIILDKKFRQQGFGSSSLKIIERKIQALQKTECISLQVAPPKPQLIRFWENNGYVRHPAPRAANYENINGISGVTLIKTIDSQNFLN